jgi:sugar lactone lactonase YvrE
MLLFTALLAACVAPSAAPALLPSPSAAPTELAQATLQPVVQSTPQLLVKGAPIEGSDGLAFGPDGNLYVASHIGRQIAVLNPDSGEIVKRLGRAEKIDLPKSVAFGSDGSLYWSSFPGWTGIKAGRLAHDGASEGAYSLPAGDWPIFFSPDGRLYVGQAFLSDGLYELDPQFKQPPRKLASPHTGIVSYTFGPDGLVYACDPTRDRVLRFDLANEDFDTDVVVDSAKFAFDTAFDSGGRLWLVHSPSPSGDQISLVDTDTRASQLVIKWTSGIEDLIIDGKDQAYFSDPFDGAIYKLLADGTVRTLSPGGLTTPGGIAVVPRADGESVVVAGFRQMREYDGATGELLHHEGANGAYPEVSITAPQAVARFGDNLILSSWWNSTIQLWDPEANKPIRVIEDLEPGPAEAIEFEGDIVYAPAGGGEVMRIDPDKDYAVEPVSPAYLTTPVGLATKDGDLFVSEWRGGTISQIADDGKFMDLPGVVVEGLEGPEGMDFAPDGRLLVVEAKAGRLTAIDLNTGEKSTIAEGFHFDTDHVSGMPDQWLLNDVAVGPSGAIYVTGDNPGAIYRLPPTTR